jgi:hypothetical protein
MLMINSAQSVFAGTREKTHKALEPHEHVYGRRQDNPVVSFLSSSVLFGIDSSSHLAAFHPREDIDGAVGKLRPNN